MTGYNPPLLFPRAIDHDGSPAPGAKLYHYVSNTSIYKPIYYDIARTSECPQPLVADSEGRFAQFFLEAGAYKFVLFDANDVQLRPPEDPIYGQGGATFDASDLAAIIGNSSEIVWNLNEDETQLLGSLVWPLTPPIGGYINAPASIYKNESGGLGHGTDTFTAKDSAGSDSRLGIEFAYSGSETTATIGDLDGTRIDFGSNVGGTGVDAHGNGLFKFDGLIDAELAGSGNSTVVTDELGRLSRGNTGKSEFLDSYAYYPADGGGRTLFKNGSERVIPANTLNSGDVIEIDIYARITIPSEDAILNFGLSDADASAYPGSGTAWSATGISTSEVWPTFTDGEVHIKAAVTVGGIVSGTTRYYHVQCSVQDLSDGKQLFVNNYNNSDLDASKALYPWVMLDMSPGGSIIKRIYRSRVIKAGLV